MAPLQTLHRGAVLLKVLLATLQQVYKNTALVTAMTDKRRDQISMGAWFVEGGGGSHGISALTSLSHGCSFPDIVQVAVLAVAVVDTVLKL